MKKIVILLLTILLTTITCFSQNILPEIKNDSTVFITSEQLKYTNLIFVEHEKILKENSLLRLQLDNYKELNNNFISIDSLRLQQIEEFNQLDIERINTINSLKKDIKNKNRTIRYWQIGGITVSIGLILFLIFK